MSPFLVVELHLRIQYRRCTLFPLSRHALPCQHTAGTAGVLTPEMPDRPLNGARTAKRLPLLMLILYGKKKEPPRPLRGLGLIQAAVLPHTVLGKLLDKLSKSLYYTNRLINRLDK